MSVPIHQLIVIARDDDTAFGILHSRFHQAWSLRLGTSLEDRPRYTPTTTFETFPFPEGLSPDIPAADYAGDPRAQAIAEAARRLIELRDRWLNPPEWVGVGGRTRAGLSRSAPCPAARRRPGSSGSVPSPISTMTGRNGWPTPMPALDAAVAAAYGWDADIGEDEALGKLLDLNLTARC